MKTPRERCLALLEIQRIGREVWLDAANDQERILLENMLVCVREYLRVHCKAAGLPWE